MRNLASPAFIYLKAALFVVIACASAALLIANAPQWQTTMLVALVAWSAARAYYFCFYVIERYIDPEYRFSGIASALVFLFKRR